MASIDQVVIATDLFSQLSETAQLEIICLIKSLLSGQ